MATIGQYSERERARASKRPVSFLEPWLFLGCILVLPLAGFAAPRPYTEGADRQPVRSELRPTGAPQRLFAEAPQVFQPARDPSPKGPQAVRLRMMPADGRIPRPPGFVALALGDEAFHPFPPSSGPPGRDPPYLPVF